MFYVTEGQILSPNGNKYYSYIQFNIFLLFPTWNIGPLSGFLWSHTIRHTVGLLWTSDQPVSETSTYSYEITSWLMQGMRDAIVSGSGYYHSVRVLRVPKILVASVGLVL
jgi:hypothetical protein